MKLKILITLALCSVLSFAYAQWNDATPGKVYYEGGNVGIGTPSPTSWFAGRTLEILDTRPIVKLSSSSPTGLATIMFTNTLVSSPSHNGEFHLNYYFNQADNSKSRLTFFSYPGNEILTLKSNGYIGIGATDPGAKLQIVSNTNSATDNTMRLEAPNIGSNNSHIHWGNTGDWYIRSASSSGRIIIQDTGGNVGIGTTEPDTKLTVKGVIHTNEVRVDLNSPIEQGPDYVFEKDYNLLSLSELETYITQNKHLPEVPSAKEMEADGLNLKEMNLILLKKVEELTLHLIEMKKEVVQLKEDSRNLKNQMFENHK